MRTQPALLLAASVELLPAPTAARPGRLHEMRQATGGEERKVPGGSLSMSGRLVEEEDR